MTPAVQQIDVDEAGLPTVAGYRQLYLIALERLAADEPSWPLKLRERVARDMAEAYCLGAIQRVQRERRLVVRPTPIQDTQTRPLPLPLIDAPPAERSEVADVG
jgi:hypothetical protein